LEQALFPFEKQYHRGRSTVKRSLYDAFLLLFLLAWLVTGCQSPDPNTLPTQVRPIDTLTPPPPAAPTATQPPTTTTPAETEAATVELPITPLSTEAISETTTLEPTAIPAATARILVQTLDGALILVAADGTAEPFALDPPDLFLFGPYPLGGLIAGTAYLLSSPGVNASAFALDSNGLRPLDFVGTTASSLVVGQSAGITQLGWSEITLAAAGLTSQLLIAESSGTEQVSVVQHASDSEILVVAGWSADGQRLYYSTEPTGFGGYILFGGFSSLYAFNRPDNTITPIVPRENGYTICLDELSPDGRFVALHCNNQVTILDWAAGTSQTIQPPAEVTAFGQLGSVRFSPDGQRVAFALARGEPENEQGWVALSDGLEGPSRLILSGEPGQYVQVMSWLDNQTFVLQSWYQGTPTIWLAYTDGRPAEKLLDATFIDLE
jgi:hypothetical protein